jgi:hypothetical protein
MILPSPTGLLNDAGLIGQILRQLPQRILEEAEKKHDPWAWLAKWVHRNPAEYWGTGTVAKRDAEIRALKAAGFKWSATGIYSRNARRRRKAIAYQGTREVCFCPHPRNPRQVLMRSVLDKPWPPIFSKTFIAAASQRNALRRLGEAALHAGSIFRSYRMEMRAAQKRGDQKAADHWANKLAAAILRMESGRRWLLEGKSWPALIRKEARRRYDCFYAADVRRLGRKKADEKWQSPDKELDFKQETACDKIAVQLTMGWLSLPGGIPGYCFLSDEMIAEVLGLLAPFLKSADWKLVRTIRERIGLKKGEIIVTSLKQRANGDWAIFDSAGRDLGVLPWSKCVPPKL